MPKHIMGEQWFSTCPVGYYAEYLQGGHIMYTRIDWHNKPVVGERRVFEINYGS